MSKNDAQTWDIDWYVCRHGGKELWRVPRSIGPVRADHNHWAGPHLAVDKNTACLISAAPELLAALQRLTLVLKQSGYATEHADAVIAKATGEHQ